MRGEEMIRACHDVAVVKTNQKRLFIKLDQEGKILVTMSEFVSSHVRKMLPMEDLRMLTQEKLLIKRVHFFVVLF